MRLDKKLKNDSSKDFLFVLYFACRKRNKLLFQLILFQIVSIFCKCRQILRSANSNLTNLFISNNAKVIIIFLLKFVTSFSNSNITNLLSNNAKMISNCLQRTFNVCLFVSMATTLQQCNLQKLPLLVYKRSAYGRKSSFF